MKVLLGIGDIDKLSFRGTEIYVVSLAKYLIAQNIDVKIICPKNKKFDKNHSYEGIEIIRFGSVDYNINNRQRLGISAPPNINCFEKIILQEKPDILHIHTIVTLLGVLHLKHAKSIGVKTVITSHVPHLVCPIGSYVRNRKPCGKSISNNCYKCIVNKKIGKNLVKYLPSIIWKPLQFMPQMSFLRFPTSLKNRLSILEQSVDCFISPSKWQIDSLKSNGFNTDKCVHITQGVKKELIKSSHPQNITVPSFLKYGYLGAFHPYKGVNDLLETFHYFVMKNDSIMLELVGNTDTNYGERLIKLFDNKTNITFLGTKTGYDLRNWLITLDALIVPSQWYDMSPLVVCEALTLGIPVLGANFGGIPEVVTHEENGVLFDSFCKEDLMNCFKKYDKDFWIKLKKKMKRPIRTSDDVGCDTLDIYKGIIEEKEL
jgi:glycosyltransferase involved in cell wall biosynthesis